MQECEYKRKEIRSRFAVSISLSFVECIISLSYCHREMIVSQSRPLLFLKMTGTTAHVKKRVWPARLDN